MNILKISLAIIFILAIVVGVVKWYEQLTPPPPPVSAKNQFINKIEQEIQQLSQKPDNKFCKEYFEEVDFQIGEFHKDKRFGETHAENDQWKNILSKNLYSTYAEKFIKQAFHVFKGTEWGNGDINFIRREYQSLQNSQLLERGSPVDQKFKEIQAIFNQYQEISIFISSSKNFSFTGTDLSDRFPVADINTKINQATRYSRSGLGNSYLNNCTRLHHELDDVKKFFFKSHINYLDNKINTWSGMYSNYNSQRTYVDNLYKQLEIEIEELDNDIYLSPNFDYEYSRLKKKWQQDANNAYNHFNRAAN
jgi:hypothetical protein